MATKEAKSAPVRGIAEILKEIVATIERIERRLDGQKTVKP